MAEKHTPVAGRTFPAGQLRSGLALAGVLLSLPLLLPAGTPLAAPAAAPMLPGGELEPEQVRSQLERWARRQPSSSELQRLVPGLGREAAPLLFETVIASQWWDGRRVGREQDELARACLSAMSRRRLLPLFEDAAGPETELPRRRLALELLGGLGTDEDLELASRLGEAPGDEDLELLEPFGEAVEGILARSGSRALGPARRLVLDLQPLFAEVLLLELADLANDRDEVALALADLLGRRAELDGVLLRSLAELLPGLSLRTVGHVAQRTERYLRADDPQLRRDAIRAAGRTGQGRLAIQLLPGLESEHRGVRAAAHEALVLLSGQPFPAEPRRWQAWLEREEAWYREELERVLGDISSGRAPTVMAGLGELLAHPLYRQEALPELERLVLDGTATLRARGLHAIAQLGVVRDPGFLLPYLSDVRPEVRTAAWKALRATTGLELAEDVDAWTRALQGPNT